MVENREAESTLSNSGKVTETNPATTINRNIPLLTLLVIVISVFISPCSILAGEAYHAALDTQIEQPIRILFGSVLMGFFILYAICVSRDIHDAAIRNNPTLKDCHYCHGAGRLTMINNPFFKTTCPVCKGTGKHQEEK